MSASSPSASHAAIVSAARSATHQRLAWTALLALGVGGCLWAVGLLDPARLTRGIPALWQLGTEMFPPDFSRARAWVRPLLDTLAMSVAGTAIAVALSLPLSLGAARNTTPNPAAYRLTRLVLNLLRSVPELIMGIFFVAAVGFGALPGALALGLHSAGMVAKFFAEAI